MKKLLPNDPWTEGPTWRRYDDGSWYLPEKSLAWGLVDWFVEYLRSPDGEGEFWPTQEQMRWLLWFYAVDDQGKYLYRQATMRRQKGAGKDVIAAVLALAELCGPVAFSHFDEKGEPVGKQRFAPWVQLAAVTQEQTKNTSALFPALITDKLKKEHRLEVCKTIIYSGTGGRIESLTASPYAAEGNRPTFSVLNEGQWWFDTNNGHDLASVIQGNITKTNGRLLNICNAHIPGENSVAEQDYDAYQLVKSGQAVDTGILYDSLEAPAWTPISEIPAKDVDPEGYSQGIKKLREGLEIARGDATWLNIDSIVNNILDVRTPVSESRRRFLNQINASEDSWIAPKEWDAIAATSDALQLKPGDKITLGFDGSVTNDWTALVACRVEDGFISLIKAWNPEKYPGKEIPREDVDAVVRSTFDTYDVVGMRADVRFWESYIDQWTRDFRRSIKINACPGKLLAYDMRGQNVKRVALDCEAFLDAVLDEQIMHDNDPILRRHILNAKRAPTNWGTVSIRKASKDSSQKIDAAVCAVLAYGSRRDYLTSKRGSRTGKAVIIQ